MTAEARAMEAAAQTGAGSLSPLAGAAAPLFRSDGDAYSLFYAPGHVCVVASEQAGAFAADLVAPVPSSGPAGDAARALREQAACALAEMERLHEEPFQPECLTLYLSNQCTLDCVYCYSASGRRSRTLLDTRAIAAAASQVAGNCRERGLGMTVVFHGGGEPALRLKRLAEALRIVEATARAHDVSLFRYLATNGVLSTTRAAWLARHFDLIGLSCDGPAEIHNRQRPARNGAGTLDAVELTAGVLHAAGRSFHVRATVTAENLARQAEIAGYLCRRLAPEEIHLEPVYAGGRAKAPDATHAPAFVTHFLAARDVARGHGTRLLYVGTRPGEIHGPYCQVLRQVLNLVPGNGATACFKYATAGEAQAHGAAIGAWNEATGEWEVDPARVRALRVRLGAVPDACRGCFARYHCARECPDRCPLDGDEGGPGFRCRVQHALAEAAVRETGAHLWIQAREKGVEIEAGAL